MRQDLQTLYQEGYRSLAIVFVHSYTFPEHELLVGKVARELGFTHVSESSQLLPMIKMVPRGVSSTADAYLTPILREYLDGFFNGFDEKLRDGRLLSPRVEFMGSDGGLLDTKNFSGLKSILSGPAGGVVGYALTSWDEKRRQPVIGYATNFLLPFCDSDPILGLMSVEPPQMSPGLTEDMKWFMRQRRPGSPFNPLSWTSTPSQPVEALVLCLEMGCSTPAQRAQEQNLARLVIGIFPSGIVGKYLQRSRKNGPLAVTDANLLLGRLITDYFPKIFGRSEKEPLDISATTVAFEKLSKEINDNHDGDDFTLDEVAYG